MKKAIAIIMAIFFGLAIASISFAVEEKMAEPVTKTKVKQVTGKVKAVDTKAKTITVVKKIKGKEKEVVLAVDEKTRITVDSEKALADVKVGDDVKAKYIEDEGKNVAKSVAIKQEKPAK